MPTIKDGDWVLKDIQEVEDEAMKVIRNSTEHNLVLAGPGSGKTELLAQKACFLIETGKCSKKKSSHYLSKKMRQKTYKIESTHGLI